MLLRFSGRGIHMKRKQNICFTIYICEVSARNLEVVACLSVCALSASTFSQDQGGCAPFTFLEAIVVRHPGKDSELRASFEFTNFECRLNFRCWWRGAYRFWTATACQVLVHRKLQDPPPIPEKPMRTCLSFLEGRWITRSIENGCFCMRRR